MNLPADATRSLRVYNTLFPLVFLLMLPGVLLRMVRRGNYRDGFGQRFGRYPGRRADFPGQAEPPVWIHSISVGETLVALKLAGALRRKQPGLPVVISVTTTTGFALARQNAGPGMLVIYNPIDLRSVVRAALDWIRPRHVLLVEGEAWPNLLAECRRRDVPVSLVNARLSPRSEARFRRFKAWTGPIFRMLDAVLVPEPADRARWASLGVLPELILHTGSIKFDGASASSNPAAAHEFRRLLEKAGVAPDAPVLLGGSTWAPEEMQLLKAWRALRVRFPNLFLILVPRHVERCVALLRELESTGARVCLRSALGALSAPGCDVLLVDTTGELRDWYQTATVVFVGKSLPGIRDGGGQNPAEPAALGKPVVYGPHMENFESVVALLRDRNAAVQVADGEVLIGTLQALLEDPDKCRDLGSRAKTAMEIHQGASDRTAERILEGKPV
jgi:3-deoxy-D-manno-octulosonic-acid transferase